MKHWHDQYLGEPPATGPWKYPPRKRSAWVHWPVFVAALTILGLGFVWLGKAIPQARMDCAAYCERSLDE